MTILKKKLFKLCSNQEFHEDEELARAIALSLEMFNRPKSAGKISARREGRFLKHFNILIAL